MTFYHGTYRLFDKFDLSHILEGDGKVKFGYGVYLTSEYKSAAHYAGVNPSATSFYVYTVEIPQITDTNHISFKEPVHPDIIKSVECKLGKKIPEKVLYDGKLFRKYLSKELTGKLDVDGEKVASEFLYGIGVEYICWPYSWKSPALGKNVAVLNAGDIKITRIEQVELDSKKQLVPDSIRIIKEL